MWPFKYRGRSTGHFSADQVSEPPTMEDLAHMNRISSVVKTYLHPSDVLSARRYVLLLMAVCGSFQWWLGPLMGIFMVDPMIQLMLLNAAVITPATDCFDFRLANQTCDTDVMVDYYFWNITNADDWISGAGPPEYQQVGPYAFRAKEIRYNMQYNENWTEVAFTYHQWAEFVPEGSCPTCTLQNEITGVNRAYLQFLSSTPASAPIDAETGVIYTLTPITLSVIKGAIQAAVYAANPGSTTIIQDSISQWTDCSLLQPLAPVLGLAGPYLKDVPLPAGVPGFPFDPELCAYIPDAVMATMGVSITPADFATYGLAMDYTAASTFLDLAIGQSNFTYLDPNAQQFLGAFLTMPQSTVIAMVGTVSPSAADALSAITPTQWLVLQGYVSSLTPTWGAMVYSQWLQSGGGGLVLTKTVDAWMYGFVDPLLLAGAQNIAAANGDAASYALSPWTFMPSVGLTFRTRDDPINYFESVTGNSYNFSMLSWNSSQSGYFHPLIQQKRMYTGKGRSTVPQGMLEYRGVPFLNNTWGIHNVTGINEAVAFGSSVDTGKVFLTWDSVLSRPVVAEYSGFETDVKKVHTLIFNMTPSSVEACNWTHFGDWAGAAGFDPDAYRASVNDIRPQDYWNFMSNDTALSEYLRDGPLGNDLGHFYPDVDESVDRCAVPDAFTGMWDMSGILVCPTIYTHAHFYGAGEEVVATTGVESSVWAANTAEHAYSLAIEPFTGYALKGHKTYQVNHLVSKSANLYPDVWTVPGSGAGVGLASDFVTVPVFWARMWWEPSDSAAMLIRIMTALDNALYYIMVVSWPVLGWLMLGPSLFILKFGRDAKRRTKELPGIQRSRARTVRLAAHEKDMVEGLRRVERGSLGVILPEPLEIGLSEAAEADEAEQNEGQVTVTVVVPDSVKPNSAVPQQYHSSLQRSGSSKRVLELASAETQSMLRAASISGGGETPLLAHEASGSSGGSETPIWKSQSQMHE